ncbi:hypothetical protein [Paracidovorax wautersii]|uniref:Uncharacterized protein n=1 Tax=Paracidovorax wautersii TaxID=1177982 RepID=A0A1I2HTZ3_9BURK|nr:hypothetical protein [Paracidovorax wautersii]SFF33222.1 hypothetical protein SAMN04489711_1342 [Paracidovorax wautersii]
MGTTLKMLAHSLQGTSRVMSVKGESEQAMMQESVVMLLGDFLLENITEPQRQQLIDPFEITSATRSDGGQCIYEKLRCAERLVITDSESGSTLLLRQVADEMDWSTLPVHFQNFIKGDDLPAYLFVAIQQQSIEGDTQHRHYALPVFAILSVKSSGSIASKYCFADARLRAQAGSNKALDGASASTLEPYLRLLLSHLYFKTEGACA